MTIDYQHRQTYTLLMAPETIPIIYQDHHLLVVNKPAGLVIHPTYKHADGTYPGTTLTVTKRENGKDEVLAGIPPSLRCDDEFILDGPLQRDPADRRRCIVGPDGQVATTILKVLAVAEGEKFVLLEVRPVTGRTHQIRAHLAALGYGIVGDQVYAPPAREGTPQAELKRQFLHAHSLELRRYPDDSLSAFPAPLAS